ncbi:hypothetical protein ALC60_01818 [Trachymyrmex zeteki]|uniref:Uncharacterized protein n=1 Tax=Mycetomoellerius zeteki TaxID=64791 RepID=A0A151XFQ8_9HYME|nr:hypothetical protein ALC60_01818 [Trachymyrmex zeteki]
MVLLPLLSNSLLPICLKNLTRMTLTRDFVRNRYTRTLPPTILTKILGLFLCNNSFVSYI